MARAGAPQWAALIALANQGRQANGLKNMTGFTETLPAIGTAPRTDFEPATGSLDTGRGSPIASQLVPYLVSWRAPQLIFTQQPTSISAGKVFSVTVTIEDQNGNILSSDNSNVTIALGPDPTLFGTTTVAAVNGVATFTNLYVNTSGNFTFIATDAADTLTASTPSAPIAITPAAASQLVYVQQPTNTTAGNNINPAVTVAVEDQFGNIVTGDNSYVTLRVAGLSPNDSYGDAVLNGAVAVGRQWVPALLAGGDCDRGGRAYRVQVQNGVATFGNIALEKAGTYMLEATDCKLTPTASSKFTVSPGAAIEMRFVQNPRLDHSDKTFGVQVAFSISMAISQSTTTPS